jgi:two-component system chemotaxis response regulator CheY
MGFILTVDDSRMMRQMIGGSVEALGYNILEAEHGKAALDLLDKRGDEVELILLDVNMPVMDGFQTLQALKDDDRLRNIPVIMVTTEGEKARIVQAIRMGAVNYVVKPFTPEELATRIVDALDQANA